MSKFNDDDDYDGNATGPTTPNRAVGYGKPPVDRQFRPGQSGNPKGRPIGSKNRPKTHYPVGGLLDGIVLEEARREVTVNETGGAIKMSIVQAITRSLALNAAKGNTRSQKLFLQAVAISEANVARARKELFDMFCESELTRNEGLEQPCVPGMGDAPRVRVILNPIRQSMRIVDAPWRELQKHTLTEALGTDGAGLDQYIQTLEELQRNEPDAPDIEDIEDDLAMLRKLRFLLDAPDHIDWIQVLLRDAGEDEIASAISEGRTEFLE